MDGLHNSKLSLHTNYRGQFCTICRRIDRNIYRHKGSPIRVKDNLDVLVGKQSEIQSRSVDCISCRYLNSLCEEDGGISWPDGHRWGSTADITLSFHVVDAYPHYLLACGNLPGADSSVSERRRCLSTLGKSMLFLVHGQVDPGTFNSTLINIDLVKRWLAACKQNHRRQCQSPGTGAVPDSVQLMFIDVESECITFPLVTVPYVALSYVWGPVESLLALRSNIDDLKCPGSMRAAGEYSVPRTVRDAMRLCSLLGRRYLWVDRVCIVQDDPLTKWKQLESMAAIYANAEFTIVAARGTDAEYGLPGLGRDAEEREKRIIHLPSVSMIRQSQWLGGHYDINDTHWSTRGWTLQEQVFSRRLLIMDTIMSWRCYSLNSTECVDWLSPDAQANSIEDKNSDKDRGMQNKLFVVDWPSLSEYSGLVRSYNQRNLTFDSDVSNAFIGTVQAMRSGFPAGFYQCLPEFYFSIALLWQPHTGLRPRFKSTGSSELPSWSWLGWHGQLDLSYWTNNTDASYPAKQFDIEITPCVKWYKDESRSPKSLVDDTFHTVRSHFRKSTSQVPKGWSQHRDLESPDEDTYYTYEDQDYDAIDKARKFRYPVPPFQRPRDIDYERVDRQFLYFTTQMAVLRFGEPNTNANKIFSDHGSNEFYAIEIPLLCRNYQRVGSICLNLHKMLEPPVGKECELIRIAEGSRSKPGQQHPVRKVRELELYTETNFDSFVFIMWIEWVNGIAFRRAVGRVSDLAWLAQHPKEVEVILG